VVTDQDAWGDPSSSEIFFTLLMNATLVHLLLVLMILIVSLVLSQWCKYAYYATALMEHHLLKSFTKPIPTVDKRKATNNQHYSIHQQSLTRCNYSCVNWSKCRLYFGKLLNNIIQEPPVI
jgi:hypothetical protein